jgi:hypothetical protein
MKTIKVKTINKETIKPIPLSGKQDTRPILGEALFPEIFANIALIAKKKSGKTTALHHILKRCAGRDTHVIFFCSTIYKDRSYVGIRNMLEKKNITFDVHTSLKEDGIDQLDELVKQLEDEAKEREESGKNKEEEEEEPKHTLEDVLALISKEGGFNKYMNTVDNDETEEKKAP